MKNIKGVISDIIFENEDTGFKICYLDCDGENVTVKGILPFIHPGETISAQGTWQENSDYGPQFIVDTYECFMPQNLEDVVIFLQSDLFTGIGESTAISIADKFGDRTIDVLKNHPEELAKVKGLSIKKASKISETYNTYSAVYEIFSFFKPFGLKMNIVVDIYKQYGEDTVNVIRENPYDAIEKVARFSFEDADRIAVNVGIPFNAEKRICAGILYSLNQVMGDGGNVFYPRELLEKLAADRLGVDISEVSECLELLDKNFKVVLHDVEPYGQCVYLKRFYEYENYVKNKFMSLATDRFDFEEKVFEDAIKTFEKEQGIQMGEMQKQAVETAGKHGLLVITGGPGTGKTTIIKAITRYFDMLGLKTVLTAPTGRAAKRITESCGKEAKTIHRLLEVKSKLEDDNPSRELKFDKNENNPLDADIIIADESSMIDLILMNHLLKAMKNGARIILVGDKDQLPSVGPGKILADLISDDVYPKVVLDEIYRQASESLIAVNAYKINHGEMPEYNDNSKDFFFISCNNQYDCAKLVTDLCAERLPKAYGYEPIRDIQVISPTKVGQCGINSLNVDLQAKLNKKDVFKPEKAFGKKIFRLGDRVMHMKNDYELEWEKVDDPLSTGVGVFNGEMGVIAEINPKKNFYKVVFDDDRFAYYNQNSVNELELCYAITAHKSQGSEFDCVVIPLIGVPQMLMSRNILYTAITRAKKFVVLVGSKETLKRMISNNSVQFRYTGMGKKNPDDAKNMQAQQDGQLYQYDQFNQSNPFDDSFLEPVNFDDYI